MKLCRLTIAKVFGVFSLCLGLIATIAILLVFVSELFFGNQESAGVGAAAVLISLAALIIGSPFGLLAFFCGCKRLGMAATALCIFCYPLAVLTLRFAVNGR
jgi:hypothetical protein